MAELRPAAERGTLEVRARALETIAEQAAREVPRTVVRRARLGGLAAQASPQAKVALTSSTQQGATGPSARIDVDVLCLWPAPLASVAEQVRDHVTARATALSGVAVTSVDVTVGATTEAGEGARRVS